MLRTHRHVAPHLHVISWHVKEPDAWVDPLNSAVEFNNRPFVLQRKELTVPEPPAWFWVGCIIDGPFVPQGSRRISSKLVV